MKNVFLTLPVLFHIINSPWFDSKLKMHKVTREIILVTECKDYEIFYALLTYCYTGHIIIDKGNVPTKRDKLFSVDIKVKDVVITNLCFANHINILRNSIMPKI